MTEITLPEDKRQRQINALIDFMSETERYHPLYRMTVAHYINSLSRGLVPDYESDAWGDLANHYADLGWQKMHAEWAERRRELPWWKRRAYSRKPDERWLRLGAWRTMHQAETDIEELLEDLED